MPGMPERHSKDCKVSVGSKTTAHRREIRLDFSATDARVQCPLWVKSGHVQCTRRCPLCAKSGRRAQLFDHFIGAILYRLRHGDAECLGSLEVEEQLDLACLLDRQVGGFLPLEDTGDVPASEAIGTL